jgi:hypothetical protein
MVVIRNPKQYIDKSKRKGKLTNIPMGERGHESSGKSGKLTKDGKVYRNDLLDTDYTSQIATRRKIKGV